MSSSGPVLPDAASTKLQSAMVPVRSVLFYTLTATLPIVILSAILLFTRVRGPWLAFLGVVGAVVGFGSLGRLLYELTLDIAGFPDYQLPVWTVLYLIVYVVSAFAFLFFALHTSAPGYYFHGFSEASPRTAYVDAVYISLCNFVGMSPDSVFGTPHQSSRFLCVSQALMAMFVNAVVITKFVAAF
jgi:hypothetical protein